MEDIEMVLKAFIWQYFNGLKISLWLTFAIEDDFTWLCIPVSYFLYILLFTVNSVVGAWTILTDFNYGFLRYPVTIFRVDLFRWGVFRRLYYACTGLVKIFLTWVVRSIKSIFVNCWFLFIVTWGLTSSIDVCCQLLNVWKVASCVWLTKKLSNYGHVQCTCFLHFTFCWSINLVNFTRYLLAATLFMQD